MKLRSRCLVLACAFLFATLAAAQTAPVFKVQIAPELAKPDVSGRLLVLMTSDANVRDNIMVPFGHATAKVWIAAKEISHLTPGTPVDLNADELAWPTPFSKAPAGDYQIQAVLDTNHNYAYYNREDAGDLVSVVTRAQLPANAAVTLTLARVVPAKPAAKPAHAELIDFKSRRLSEYWGRPEHIRGWLVTPPDYEKNKTERYPTAYVTHGYGGDLQLIAHMADEAYSNMEKGAAPRMIWVVLDESSPRGTHEFADSANNGPWGDALTRELIPHLESKYRMIAKPAARFVTGHSSGGWAAAWLQVAYPDFFGGSWPTAPDPVDFRNFTGVDLTKDTNFYRKPDGTARPLVRMSGKEIMTLEEFARMERVMGDYGGQMASFEYVFSPRGEDGRPMQLFDRDTGTIDRNVANAWEKYDIARIIRENSKQFAKSLDGKIHLIVGTEDTFHLEEPAHLLEQTMKAAGINASFEYIPGRDHLNLYRGGLGNRIAKEMYQTYLAATGKKAKAKAASE